jgi:(2Fe-2S) ferredoxin
MKSPKQNKSTLKAHCFICTRCEGGQELRDSAKSLAKEQFPDMSVRINASGCLAMCDDGIASIYYPGGISITELDQQKAPYLIKTIKNLLGQTIE